MNSITKFFHDLFNPHCQHCADERREQRENERYCASCESIGRENARLVHENERLLSLLLDKPAKKEETITDMGDLKPLQTSRFVPIAVKRQLLENEARHTARLKQEAPKPEIDKDVELQELEQELKDVREKREKAINQ